MRLALRAWLVSAVLLSIAGWPPATAQERVFVEAGSAMRFLPNTDDPGVGLAWTETDFDDSAWTDGSYGVGYEASVGAEHLIETAVPLGTWSVFTRTVFVVADVSSVAELWVGADYDDGVVFWLNGQEVYRTPEMPAGPPAWNAVPAQHESSNGVDPSYAPFVDLSVIAIPLLQQGENVLAVGVWNGGAGSSDLVLVPKLVANPAFALVRGPYLQSVTPTSVRVRWRTGEPQTSRVDYGATPGSLTQSVSDATPKTEHDLLVSGLDPATRYDYAIGSETQRLVGDDGQHFFKTAPSPGTPAPTRIWVIGDSGTADANSRAVRDAYVQDSGTAATDLWLMLGDNAYEDGTDTDYQRAVFDVFPRMLRNTVLWPALGNHDLFSADSTTQTGPYFDIFSLPQAGEAGGLASGTEAYYSFDHANIHFVVLDSLGSDASPPPAGAMLTWLANDLAATSQDWIVAYWHHPPYSDGSHKSDLELPQVRMRENAVPILEDLGVDVVLTGHSHNYERSFLIDGHHGDSSTFGPAHVLDPGSGREDTADGAYFKPGGAVAHAGAVYAVAGTGGSIHASPLDYPAMFIGWNELGSLVLDVAGHRLDARFIDTAGEVLDYFTLIKPAPCAAGPDADADGLCDDADNCPAVFNPTQGNGDADGTGDACDVCPADPLDDPDADGACEADDNCPGTPNPGQADADGDGTGDACDVCPDDPDDDADADGVCADVDNCPAAANPTQADADADGAGDACDPCPNDPDDDADADGVCADVDNCPTVPNPAQADGDADGRGDLCDPCPFDPTDDTDGDGTCESLDNCPGVPNADQADADSDDHGDACDACPLDPDDDFDGDGHCANADNCPGTFNPSQADEDGDGVGDACDVPNDLDGDGIRDEVDNCPNLPNPVQQDSDGDGRGDVCDGDDDGDGIEDALDCAPLAAGVAAAPQPIGPTLRLDKRSGGTIEWQGSWQGHVSNVHRGPWPAGPSPLPELVCIDPGTPLIESVDPAEPPAGVIYVYLVTSVNLCGESPFGVGSNGNPRPFSSSCPPSGADSDSDGVADVADNCPLVPNATLSDFDGDFVGDSCDNCPTYRNGDQTDGDGDGRGDACAALADVDNDGIEDDIDNCPADFNTEQEDLDADEVGDACDTCPVDPANDADADGHCADVDNCPAVPNPGQANADLDARGDACDGCPADANKVAPGQCGCGVAQCWIVQNSEQSKHLQGVHATSPEVAHAVGERGLILATANGGTNWTVQEPADDLHLEAVQFVLGGPTGYAAGEHGTVLKTTNFGATWVPLSTGLVQDLFGLHFPLDASVGYAVGKNGRIGKTVNGGNTWVSVAAGGNIEWRGVHFLADTTTGWIVGEDGTVRKTTNGGTSWVTQNSGTEENLYAVQFVDAMTGYAAGEGGTLIKTSSGGTVWAALDPGTDDDLFSVHFPTPEIGYVVGEDGTIRKTTNGGATWVGQPSGTGVKLFDVHFAPDAVHGWAVGENGLIRRSTE